MATTSRNIVEILFTAKDTASTSVKDLINNLKGAEKQALIVGTAIGAGAAATVTALAAITRNAASYADQIDNLSQRTLVSRDTLAAIGLSLKRTGEDFFASEQAVRTFQRAMVEAISGGREQREAFDRLGISVEELTGPGGRLKTLEELLPLVADRFSGLESQAARVSVALSLFGRSGTAMIPVLSKGSRGLKELEDRARAMGLALSDADTKALAQFDDNLNDAELAVKGLAASIGGALAPAFVLVSNEAIKAITEMTELDRKTQGVTQVVGGVALALTGGAGLVAALVLSQKVMERMSRVAVGLGLSLRGLLIASTVSAVILGVAGAAAFTVRAIEELRNSTRSAEESERDYQRTLNDTRSSLQQVMDAQAAAARAREKEAADRFRLNRTISMFTGALPGGTTVTLPVEPKLAVTPPSVEIAVKQVQADLERRLKAGSVQPTITVPVKIGDTAEEIQMVQADIERLQRDLESASKDRSLIAQSEVGEGALAEAVAKEQQATDKLNAAKIRLLELRRRLSDEEREAAQRSRDTAAALLLIDEAAKRISIDDLMIAQREAVDKAAASLEAAREKVNALAAGTFEHGEATKQLADAVAEYERTLSMARETEQRLVEDRAKARETARELADAYIELADAQAAQQIIRDTSGGELEEKRLRLLGQRQAVRDVAEAERAWLSGPLPVDEHLEALANLTEATHKFNAAFAEDTPKAARRASDELADLGRSTGRNFASSLTSALTSAEKDWAQIFRGLANSAVSELLQVAFTLKAVETTGDAVSAATKGASVGAVAAAATAGQAAASAVVAATAAQAAAAAAERARAAAAGSVLPIGPFGALASIFGFAIPGLQGGGKIVNGSRGRDTLAVAIGKDEAVIDHRLTHDLERFLVSQRRPPVMASPTRENGTQTRVRSMRREGPSIGALSVNISAQTLTSRADGQKIALRTRRELERLGRIGTSTPRFTGSAA